VQDAQQAFASEVYRRGAHAVYSTPLPLEENGEKTGLDDFLAGYGVEAFLNLDLEEIASPYPPFKVWSLADLRAAGLVEVGVEVHPGLLLGE